jgi:hypothetical protein
MNEDEQKEFNFNQVPMYETTIPSDFNSTTAPNGGITPSRRTSVMNVINRRPSASFSQCPFSGHKGGLEPHAI